MRALESFCAYVGLGLLAVLGPFIVAGFVIKFIESEFSFSHMMMLAGGMVASERFWISLLVFGTLYLILKTFRRA